MQDDTSTSYQTIGYHPNRNEYSTFKSGHKQYIMVIPGDVFFESNIKLGDRIQLVEPTYIMPGGSIAYKYDRQVYEQREAHFERCVDSSYDVRVTLKVVEVLEVDYFEVDESISMLMNYSNPKNFKQYYLKGIPKYMRGTFGPKVVSKIKLLKVEKVLDNDTKV